MRSNDSIINLDVEGVPGHEAMRFGSLTSFVRTVLAKVETENKGGRPHWGRWGPSLNDESFSGRDLPEMTEKIALTPDPDDIDFVKDFEERVKAVLGPLVDQLIRPLVWSAHRPGRVSARRLLDGRPTYRRSRKNRATKEIPILRIGCNVSMRCIIEPKVGFMRAACMIALAEALEAVGYRGEIWGIEAASNVYSKGKRHFAAAWKCKASDQPMNRNAITAALSSWFFRTLVFEANSLTRSVRETCSGLGYPNHSFEYGPQLVGEKDFVLFDLRPTNDPEEMIHRCLSEARKHIAKFADGSHTGGEA